MSFTGQSTPPVKPFKPFKPFKLRDYQKDAIEAAVKNATPRSLNILVMPTGSGKTAVICEIVNSFPDLQILIITPRIRLLEQLLAKLGLHGVLSSNLGNDLGDCHTVIAGTIQTIVKRGKIKRPDLIIIDECHLVPSNGPYANFVRQYPNAAVIGLTATPYRGTDKITECGLRWNQIYSVPMSKLIEEKYLVPPRCMATVSKFFNDGDELKTLNSVTRQIIPNLTAAVASEARKKCLLFCVSIEHAELTCELLKSAGEKFVYVVHSRQSPRTQKDIIDNFENSSERAWLVNVALISIGVDLPAIDCIAILRDVSSFALLLQMIGRGLRLSLGKLDCLIYDFGGGTQRFGRIDEPQFSVAICGNNFQEVNNIPPVAIQAISLTTTLNAIARSTQLLKTDYISATVVSSRILQNVQGIWVTEHDLSTNSEKLRSKTAKRTKIEASRIAYPPGRSMLVKRLHRDFVEIVSPY
jgi:DNA repair protein RadD